MNIQSVLDAIEKIDETKPFTNNTLRLLFTAKRDGGEDKSEDLKIFMKIHDRLDRLEDRLAILEEIMSGIKKRSIVLREVNVLTGQSTLSIGNRSTQFQFSNEKMQTIYGHRWRMFIIGAGQLSLCLASFALTSDFDITIIDPREEYAEGIGSEGIQFIQGMPDDVMQELGVDSHTAIVALTHDPKIDDLALIDALQSEAFYVGALGSHTNTQKRKERLREFNLSTEQLERLHGPVGLAIGALTPPEIAVSIMAEVIAVKYGKNAS
jgi:xanthine dehydrogenase accessory factor